MKTKAQNEIMGFVIIVVLVVIVFLVIFSLSIGRKNNEILISKRVSHLLSSSMHYTTTCEDMASVASYKNLQNLIRDCYKARRCEDGRDACTALNETIIDLFSKSLEVHPNKATKGYATKIYYQLDEDTPTEPILEFGEGIFTNCTAKYGARTQIDENPTGFNSGKIYVQLEVCRNEED